MTLRVLNLMGAGASSTLSRAVPGVEVVDVDPDTAPEELDGDVLFGWSAYPSFLALAERVPWVHLPGTGIDEVPHELFTGRVVTCSRGLSAIPIAEFVLAAMLAFEKQLPQIWLHERPPRWNFAGLGELCGKTVGLVGLGGIGTAVAVRALAFDVRLRAVRRSPARGAIDGVALADDLHDLVSTADHLVLAAPSTERTRRLVDAEVLAAVKPGLHLVNVARGALVDQDALRVALDDGRVAMATLDCVDPEPLPRGHWLYSHPRVRLSAHVSWDSPRAFDRILDAFAVNLRRRVAGEPLEGLVDPDEGY